MPEPIATTDDVRAVASFPEKVDDPDIEAKLGDAVFDIYRYNDASDFDGEEHRKQAEKRVAALKLMQYVNGARSVQQESLGSAQRSFNANAVEELRSEAIDLLPNGEFLHESKPTARIDVPRVR